MKKKKIIALTSIIAFSFFIFSPKVFAEDTLTNQNIITKETSANTTSSENKSNQENKPATNEIKNNKIDNSQNNNIKKENTENKADTNKIKNNEVDNNVKKENTEDKKVVSEVNNTNSDNKDIEQNKVAITPKSEAIEFNAINEVSKDNNSKEKDTSVTNKPIQLVKGSTTVSAETINPADLPNLPDDTIVTTKNKDLQILINRNLHWNSAINAFDPTHDNDPLTVGGLRIITMLNACNVLLEHSISLAGIQICFNLQSINISGADYLKGKVTNISGIGYCKKLVSIGLSNNNLSNISDLSTLPNLKYLYMNNNQVSDLSPLKNTVTLEKLYMNNNKLSDLSPLENKPNLSEVSLNHNVDNATYAAIHDLSSFANANNLRKLYINSNFISDLSPLKNLKNLNEVDLSNNAIQDIKPLEQFKATNLKININNQGTLWPNPPTAVVEDGSGEISNPIEIPNSYTATPFNFFSGSTSFNDNIKAIDNGTKFKLVDLSDSISSLPLTEQFNFTNNNGITGSYSVKYTLNMEHISMIKVQLPTSMTFDVVTNTIDPQTNSLKPTFATADYTVQNNGKKPVTITPSYSVITQGGVDLVESINESDIARDNDVKIAVKLKNLSTNKEIMSVVPNAKGTPFNIDKGASIKLRFEPGVNGMADAEKEQLSGIKKWSVSKMWIYNIKSIFPTYTKGLQVFVSILTHYIFFF